MNFFPMDSIRIDVLSIDDKENAIRTTCREFLDYLRIRTKQWWVGRSMDFIMGFLRNVVPLSDSGILMEPSQSLLQVRTINGDEQALNNDMWLMAVKDMENKSEIPANDYLLLDAYYYAYVNDIRSAVIHAASACEQAKDLAFEHLWKRSGMTDTFKRGKVLSGYDLPDHISQDLESFAGFSYLKLFPDEFRQIEDSWNARGSIAHGGPNVFWRDRKQMQINQDLGIQLVKVADHCIQWLKSL